MRDSILALTLAAATLVGCADPRTGAYQAVFVQENGASRVAGIAILSEDKIIADGQEVKVAKWDEADGSITAVDQDGKRLIKFEPQADGTLSQVLDGGHIIYRKYDLPSSPWTW